MIRITRHKTKSSYIFLPIFLLNMLIIQTLMKNNNYRLKMEGAWPIMNSRKYYFFVKLPFRGGFKGEGRAPCPPPRIFKFKRFEHFLSQPPPPEKSCFRPCCFVCNNSLLSAHCKIKWYTTDIARKTLHNQFTTAIKGGGAGTFHLSCPNCPFQPPDIKEIWTWRIFHENPSTKIIIQRWNTCWHLTECGTFFFFFFFFNGLGGIRPLVVNHFF